MLCQSSLELLQNKFKMPLIPICSICCEHYTPDCIIKITKCGHIFHRECILRCLINTPNCPECRQFGPVLYRVYLNFNDDTSADNEANNSNSNAIISESQQHIENLIIKLSLEEDKIRNFEKRVQELERKLREHTCAARIKEEEFQKTLKSYENVISKVSLEQAKKPIHAAEEAEKSVKKDTMAIKSRQQKSTSTSITIGNRSLNTNAVLKLRTSNCTRMNGNCSRANVTASSASTSASSTSSLRKNPSASERVVCSYSLALGIESSTRPKISTENVSL